MKDKIKNLSAGFLEKWKKAVIIAGVIGIILIFVSEYIPKKEKTPKSEEVKQSSSLSYEEGLTQKLENMVSAITGSKSVTVTVTLEKSYEYIYAADKKESTGESSYIILKNSGGGQNLVSVTEIEPTVKGVVIVCEKGGSPIMKQSITDAVTTALGISYARVCVLELH